MHDVVIYGSGGLGRMVRDILAHSDRYQPVAFLDSDLARHGEVVDGLPVRGGIDDVGALRREGITHVVVAVGDNRARLNLAVELEARGMQLASAIHPLAMISPSAQLGRHLIIGARVTICVHAHIGDHTTLSPGCIIEHDNVLGTAVFLDPAVRLAGGVRIEDLSYVGIGACVIPGRCVGRACRVEPGSVVIHDVPPGASAGGVPATIQPAEASRFVPDKVRIPPAPAPTTVEALP